MKTRTLTRCRQVATVVLAMVLVGTACSTSDNGAASSNQSVPDPEPTAEPISTAAPTESSPPPEAGELSVAVEWVDDDDTIRFRDRTEDWGGYPNWTLSQDGDLVTIGFEGECGDECSFANELVLRDLGAEPEFVYFGNEWEDVFDEIEGGSEVTSGRLEMFAWDLSAKFVAGRLFDGDATEPRLVFYFNDDDMSPLARLDRGEPVTDDELRTDLTSNDDDQILDALLAIESTGPATQPHPSFESEYFELLDGGPLSNREIMWSATLGLSNLIPDRRFLGLRRPLSVYLPGDLSDPTQVQTVRANWHELLGAPSVATWSAWQQTSPEDSAEFAGEFTTFTFMACNNDDWSDPCGLSLNLLCNGNAFWNEGNVIVTSAWGVVDGRVVFEGPAPDLSAFTDDDAHTWLAEERFEQSSRRRCS